MSVVDLNSDSAADLVEAGDLDIGLSAYYQPPPRVSGVTMNLLMKDPLYLVLPDDHPVVCCSSHTRAPARGAISKRVVDFADLADADWAAAPSGRPARTQLDQVSEENGFTARVPFQTESYDVMLSLAASGVAVSLVAELALASGEGGPVVPARCVVRHPAQPLYREVYTITPAIDEQAVLVEPFLAMLRSVVAERHEKSHLAVSGR